VEISERPLPSRSTETEIWVSLVLRETLAVRPDMIITFRKRRKAPASYQHGRL